MHIYKSFFSRLISLYYPVLCMIWWIKEGHRFVDILLIKNWTLSALPFTLGWPMPILTNGEQWKWWYSSPRCNLYKDWQLPPWSLGDPSLHVRSLTTLLERQKEQVSQLYGEEKELTWAWPPTCYHQITRLESEMVLFPSDWPMYQWDINKG